VTFGVFKNDNLIGIVTLRSSLRLKTKHNGHLAGMYVDKNHRRQGIGKLLIHEVISYAKAHDIINLFLTVTSSNLDAIKLYEHMGFIRYGVEEREILHKGTYLDSYLYAYYLPF
jgi:ribosomal protein S18 acetylase RimI-like enzyme